MTEIPYTSRINYAFIQLCYSRNRKAKRERNIQTSSHKNRTAARSGKWRKMCIADDCIPDDCKGVPNLTPAG